MRVSLFVTCLVDLLEPEVGVATVRLVRAAGHQVSCPGGQTCCGQPAWNSGFHAPAAEVARASLDALDADGADAVVVPAGSCATMMTVFWPELFELAGDHDAAERARRLAGRIHELSAFLADQPLELQGDDQPGVGYHHSCHMLRELRIDDAPEALLGRAGQSRAAWDATERCCGFGGLFSFKLPETSEVMADEKLRSLREAGITTLVGSDGSCLMHLRARAAHTGQALRTVHLAEVLAERLAGPGTSASATEVAASGTTRRTP